LSPALAVKFIISSGRWQHFPLWPLFLLREKGKQTEMTVTQHVGILKHKFLHYVTIKMVLVIFHYQNNILVFCTCHLVATSTGSKLQLFQRCGVSGNPTKMFLIT
jgi:hypothetical protein